MARYVDRWDIGSGNYIGTFATQEEALAVVAALLDANGEGYADELDLGEVVEENQFRPLATGDALVDMAREAGPLVEPVGLKTEQG